MNTNFVLVGKPYNPDLKKIKNCEYEILIANYRLDEFKYKKAKQNFVFAGIGGLLYGAIVLLSRRRP